MSSPMKSRVKGRVKGWCPSLLRPMQAADGWLARIKPSRGLLSAAAARAIAAASTRLGNGRLELTQRAGLQVRGLQEADLEAFATLVLDQGLAAADPALEARRNIIASPLIGFDEDLKEDPQELVSELERALAERPALAALPDKFGFLVDGGGLLPLTGISADIALRCAERRIELGNSLTLTLPPEVPMGATAIALAEAFVAVAAGRFRRLRSLLESEGAAALLARAGVGLAAQPRAPQRAESPSPGLYGRGERVAALAVWPFGALTADALAAAAWLAEQWGDGQLRLTPWRALAIAGVAPRDWSALAEALVSQGAIVAPGNPLLSAAACPGLGACGEAAADTRSLARCLAAETALPAGGLHVSGCSKGCANPRPAALTLVATETGWALVRNGRADSPPARRGLTQDEVLDLARHA